MKIRKYISAPFLCVGVLSLSACAMFGGDNAPSSSASGAQQSTNATNQADETANQKTSGQTQVAIEGNNKDGNISPNSNQPSSAISLESKDNRVYAHVVTNWGDTKEGDLAIKWIPPQGSNCQESSFVITKYKDSDDDTWAYRTYNSSMHQCIGVWQAQVISSDGDVLSSAEVDAK